MKKVLILGSGVSGKSAAKFLINKGFAVTCVDAKEIDLDFPASFFSDKTDFPCWDFDLVVVSPGVFRNHPLLERAKKEKTQVIGELELGCKHVRQPCVAITGTNGKTTTTSLICHVLRSCEKKAQALGNIGRPLTEYALHPDVEEIIVLEVSSFQLETLSSRCFDHAVILNISPDHLDRYESFYEYASFKCHIGKLIKPGGFLYLSKQVQQEFNLPYPHKIIPEMFEEHRPDLIAENVSAAFQICSLYGVSEEKFVSTLSSFPKSPHRIECIRELKGISFYNDSKATNPHSVVVAVKYLEKDIWLLAGGKEKGLSFKSWAPAFRGKVKGLFVFGEAANQIARDLEEEFLVVSVANLEEALQQSFKKAKKGEKILLSPGCSSYDQFQNFAHRGDAFRRQVMRLI